MKKSKWTQEIIDKAFSKALKNAVKDTDQISIYPPDEDQSGWVISDGEPWDVPENITFSQLCEEIYEGWGKFYESHFCDGDETRGFDIKSKTKKSLVAIKNKFNCDLVSINKEDRNWAIRIRVFEYDKEKIVDHCVKNASVISFDHYRW